MTQRERRAYHAFKNRQEIIKAGLTRRDMFKLGLITGAGYLVMKSGLSARASGQCQSPQTSPFVEALPTHLNGGMVKKEPLGTLLNPAPTVNPNTTVNPLTMLPYEGRTRPHQLLGTPRFDPRNDPARLFELVQREATNVVVHPALPPQTVWGFDGRVPGPTFVARYGQPILVRNVNRLPANNGGFGFNHPSTHLHNGHNPSESDGFPCDSFAPGQYYDHHYPNVLAGFASTHSPDGDPNEAMSTLWYHDHRVGFTSQNVYKGLVGFYLLFNEKDTGNETSGFHVPSFPDFDVPLVLTDKVLDPCTGLITFDLFNLDGVLGDKFMVNGKIQPYFRVKPRRYRLRICNAGPSRFYELFLTEPNNVGRVNRFWQISNDGNLLPGPIKVSSVRLSVAERADIVVDFRNFRGRTIYLENRLEQVDGRAPTGRILPAGQGNPLLQFIVEDTSVTDESVDFETNPNVTFYPLPNKTVRPQVTRLFRFDRQNGMWTINGQVFDEETCASRFRVQRNTVEKWILQNNSGGWQHPIHIHFEEFQILKRNGVAPAPGSIENARKDVARLEFNEQIELLFRFRDLRGPYVMHCHNVVHEDHAMMLRFDIEDAGDTKPIP